MLWQAGRWRFLLNLVDHLPRNSAYGDAIAQDDELYEHHQPTGGASGPLVQEWTPEVEALATILDVLLLIHAQQVATAGGKPAPFKPTPRPQTALDRVEASRRARRRAAVESILFPEGG